ncbi:phage tail tape measure protein [Pseudomonas syringae]|uniref:phage tail tape measure protein n=1 Tax=Pseudomonas syringae TaxID=317 RepID=UPI00101135D3|nr:phage tail tape measure protein [Pseudomonas syringae]RXU07007.1 phage tail tape measure protein [Pseudomonas syringae]RXU07020.1 phage tail tape measure protein [Pseudomonas syringae]
MAEQKYSLRLAAVDAYTSTFGDFSKKTAKINEGMREQRAEIDRLNRAARSADGFDKLSEKVVKTKAALQAARLEQNRLGREQKAAAVKVQELNQQHAEASARLSKLSASSQASTAQIRAARVETTRLARDLKSASADMGKLDTAQDKASASVKTLSAAQRAERNELKSLQSALKGAGVDTGKLASEQKRLKTETAAANNALQAQQAKLKAVQGAQSKIDGNRGKRAELRGQMVETAAMAYVATRPINHAMDMQTSMADVGKVINFGEGEREAMASANLKLASDRMIASSGMTAIDLAKIEYAAGQSGIGNDVKNKDGTVDQKGKQAAIMDFTRDAAIMGAAFDIGAQEAGETMAGWRASMNLNRAQTLDLADSTNYLGNSFNATASDIASVVKRYGAVGKASGMSPEQTAALSAAFLNPGTEKEIAGTGFKNFTAALTKGQAATKGQKEAWKDLGFDPVDLSRDMQKNAPDTIMRVLKAIKQQPVAEQAAVATELFGSESIGAIQPLLQNLGEVQRAFDMVKDKSKYATSALGANGSMMQEAAGVANTSRTGWNSFTARLTRLSTVIGTAMLPAVDAVLAPLGKVVDMIADAAEAFPGVTSAIAIGVAGLVAAKVAITGLKFGGLLLGQGLNKGGLLRAKLGGAGSPDRTAASADRASKAVARLNSNLDRLGGQRGAGGPRITPRAAGAARTAGAANRSTRRRESRAARAAVRRSARSPAARITPVVSPTPAPAPAAGSRFAGSRARIAAAAAATTAAAAAGSAMASGGSSIGFSGAGHVSARGGLPAAPDALIRPAAASAAAAPVVRLVAPGASGAPGATSVVQAARQAAPIATSAAPAAIAAAAPVASQAASTMSAAIDPVASEAAAVTAAAVKADPPAWVGAVETLAESWPAADDEPGHDPAGGPPGGPHPPGGRRAKLKRMGKKGAAALMQAAPALLSAGMSQAGDEGSSTAEVGASVGSAGGSMAGAWAGAQLGATIGTFILPGVGTAIGGALGGLAGGFAGGEVGDWLGDKIGGWFSEDKLSPPDQVASDLAAGGISESKNTTFAPSITIQPSGDPAYDKGMADKIMERIRAEFQSMMLGGDSSLGQRRSSSLTDGGS